MLLNWSLATKCSLVLYPNIKYWENNQNPEFNTDIYVFNYQEGYNIYSVRIKIMTFTKAFKTDLPSIIFMAVFYTLYFINLRGSIVSSMGHLQKYSTSCQYTLKGTTFHIKWYFVLILNCVSIIFGTPPMLIIKERF